MVTITFAGEFDVQLNDSTVNMLNFKHFLRGRLPDLKRHPFHELQDRACIQAIRLTSLQDGCGEVFDRFRIDNYNKGEDQ